MEGSTCEEKQRKFNGPQESEWTCFPDSNDRGWEVQAWGLNTIQIQMSTKMYGFRETIHFPSSFFFFTYKLRVLLTSVSWKGCEDYVRYFTQNSWQPRAWPASLQVSEAEVTMTLVVVVWSWPGLGKHSYPCSVMNKLRQNVIKAVMAGRTEELLLVLEFNEKPPS